MPVATETDWQDAALSWAESTLNALPAVKALKPGSVFVELRPPECPDFPGVVLSSVFSSDLAGGCVDSLGGDVILQVAVDACHDAPSRETARRLMWALHGALSIAGASYSYNGLTVTITSSRTSQNPPSVTRRSAAYVRRTSALYTVSVRKS